jgi:3-keto-disaccharide hydrolase
MNETQCKTRYRLRMAVLCIGYLVFTLHTKARSKEPDDKGFVPLFNGQDFSGWQTTGNWVFEPDGVVALKPTHRRLPLIPDYKSFLWCNESYDDFVLDLEFKVGEKANSGVFLRSSSQRSYIQTQIRDSHGKQGPLDNSDCGAVVDVAAPSKNMSKPAGQWNRMIITCKGNRMQVELNGEVVINLDLDDSRRTRTVRSGRIAFENKNNSVAFRNVRIKELSQE